MKALVLTEAEWKTIRGEIDKNHPRSVTMVRWKMREVLGFTPREHEEWVVFDRTGIRERRTLKKTVHLDFYNEPKRTMFLLKYGDWIGHKASNS